MRRLFGIMFCFHLILITVLVIVLTVQGLRPNNRGHHFHPTKWYPPLLTSTAYAAFLSLVWQSLIGCNPYKAFKAAFWLSPLLTFAVAVLLLTVSSSASLAAGIAALLCSVVMALYGCWASPRFEYGIQVLTVSGASPPPKSNSIISLSMLVAIVYSCFLVTGIGGARAKGTKTDALFISIILISLVWTMQVIRGTILASISRVKFMSLAFGIDINTHMAFRDTFKHLMGSICIGSFLVPILGVIWGSARAITLVAGDTDEFLFSCANCYAGLASTLVMYANRWGFVHVGVYNKGFVQASMDVWDMFRRMGLESLVDSDLTGSFCFLSGVAVGAISGLVSGSWALAVQKSYAIELSLYAFFIGYFMVTRSSATISNRNIHCSFRF